VALVTKKLVKSWSNAGQMLVILGDFLGFWDKKTDNCFTS